MRYKDLLFFDKNGNSLNFNYNESTQAWYGSIFMPRVSVELFEIVQIFIIQKMYDNQGILHYAFPHELEEPSSINEPGWSMNWNYDQPSEIFFFTYNSNENVPYLSQIDQIDIELDWDPSQYYNSEGRLYTTVITDNLIQLNIALSSKNENIYKRTASIIDKPTGNLIAEIVFYGEVIGEDPRLSVITNNLGYTVNNSDYQIFKDSDIKEPLYNHIFLNEKKKEILLEGSNIYPYTGSYKALINAIKYFGYDDIYMKEYWRNVDSNSPYFGKYVQTLPIELLKSTARFNDINTKVPSTSLRKTGKFGLFYKLNRVKNEYDEYDLPITEETYSYTIEEVLIKLFGLKQKLQKDFLPLNAKIIDITGEADFFTKNQIVIQPSAVRTETVLTGISAQFDAIPGKILFLKDLRTIDILDFAKYTPYNYGQNMFVGPRELIDWLNNKYPNDNGKLGNSTDGSFKTISDLTNVLLAYFSRYAPNLDEIQKLPDNTNIPIGAPLILQNTSFPIITWNNSDSYWQQLDSIESTSQVFSWIYLEYRNSSEIEWIITKPVTSESPEYYYEIRGNINEYNALPIFLPYIGFYDVEMRIYDYYNNISTSRQNNYIEVKARNLEIIGTYASRSSIYNWDIKEEIPISERKPGQPSVKSPLIKNYASYWDLPFLPNDSFDNYNVSWEMFNRANYALNNQYSSFANFHISTFRDNDDYSFVGPFFWNNLDSSRWIDNDHNWWEGTVLAGDTPAFFNIIYYNPINPNVVLTLVDSTGIHKLVIPQLENIEELSYWLNGTDDPIFSKFVYNPIRNKDDYNDILYIQCVSKYFGKYGDFYDIYGNTTELSIGRTSKSKNYSINWNSAKIINNQIKLERSTHIVFSYDLSKINGKDHFSAIWKISNNTNIDFGDDKYITSRYLAYLFDKPGQYTISLFLNDTNGNKYKINKNFLIIN